ncbi:hypothetical protein ACOME3_006047 [Neoechinorhynchus agilis]
MFIFDWFMDALRYMGLYQKKGKLIFIGLDDAGKTTLLHMLREGRMATHVPTLHPTSEELTVENITFTTHDLGGHEQARKVWQTYFPVVDAIVFVVDASNRARLADAKKELDDILLNEDVINCPVLVLGNKIDKPGAAAEYELVHALGVQQSMTGKGKISRQEINGRPLEVFMCSILKKQGYGEGFRWLTQYF